MVLLTLWRYFSVVVLDGYTDNSFLYSLPPEIQGAALDLGKFIAQVLFG